MTRTRLPYITFILRGENRIYCKFWLGSPAERINKTAGLLWVLSTCFLWVQLNPTLTDNQKKLRILLACTGPRDPTARQSHMSLVSRLITYSVCSNFRKFLRSAQIWTNPVRIICQSSVINRFLKSHPDSAESTKASLVYDQECLWEWKREEEKTKSIERGLACGI